MWSLTQQPTISFKGGIPLQVFPASCRKYCNNLLSSCNGITPINLLYYRQVGYPTTSVVNLIENRFKVIIFRASCRKYCGGNTCSGIIHLKDIVV